MPRFHLDDFKSLENTPTSAATLRSKISEVITNSVHARAKVESMNPETGEFRVVLQGTLDLEAWKSNRW